MRDRILFLSPEPEIVSPVAKVTGLYYFLRRQDSKDFAGTCLAKQVAKSGSRNFSAQRSKKNFLTESYIQSIDVTT